MNIIPLSLGGPARLRPARENWLMEIFAAKAAQKGGIVRRAVRDVEREVGRDMLIAEVKRRNFHLVENGGQFIIICNQSGLKVHC